MIKFENTQVVGFEPAIRGMRNPMNSWEKSDSRFFDVHDPFDDTVQGHDISGKTDWYQDCTVEDFLDSSVYLGEQDKNLMERLNAGGSEHAKYRRMIVVYVDVTAPLYWWKEMDTYKVGTVANSCSTMHKIAAKPFELEDFSHDHLFNYELYDENEELYAENKTEILVLARHPNVRCGGVQLLHLTINTLNFYRDKYNLISRRLKEDKDLPDDERNHLLAKQKLCWWQMIQLLPSSYNQKRTLMLNYEVLANIYRQRKGHKLDEWHAFREWIESLPYSELITGEREKAE